MYYCSFFLGKALIITLIILILGLVAYLLFEAARMMISVRKMINRAEMLTDLKGWFEFIRKLPFRKSRDK